MDKSAVSEHVWNNNHNIDWANVSIIDRDSQIISRRIREAVHIRRSSGASLMNRDEDLELTHMWDSLLNINYSHFFTIFTINSHASIYRLALTVVVITLIKEPVRALKCWSI